MKFGWMLYLQMESENKAVQPTKTQWYLLQVLQNCVKILETNLMNTSYGKK